MANLSPTRRISLWISSLLPSCEDVARLVSDSHERPLGWQHRVTVRVHFAVCIWCRRYARQLRLLSEVLRRHTPDTSPDSPHLPEAARERLKQAVRGAQE
ncbi:MAG: zf-HC2 domain-containing protein [Acidobacteria bacterium]|nr:zf-HC2 domain-containing protein [Acidobacteriota bacterium]